MKNWLVAVLTLLALTSLSYFWLSKSSQKPLLAEINYELPAEELLKMYVADELEADKKYLNKVVLVEGNVQSIVDNNQGIVSIALSSEKVSERLISTFFLRDRPKSGSIKVGDKVRIKGLCSGLLLDVFLTNCQILDTKSPSI